MTTTASDAPGARRMAGTMQTPRRIPDVRRAVAAARAAGKRVGLVPTMGALHDGHLTLIDTARTLADFVIVSVFVNPLQFGPGEDLASYPRDVDGDIAKAAARGANAVFLPDADEMYPAGERRTRVVPATLADRWEGAVRPGHFEGVLTVVTKLFNIVLPDIAVFGQKDAQQAAIVRSMARDLDFPVEIVVVPTVREPDGLAMSSRNVHLSPGDRQRALALSQALAGIRNAFGSGERGARSLEQLGLTILAREAIVPDYLAVVHPETLAPVAAAAPGSLVLVAARVGGTRLIDNISLAMP